MSVQTELADARAQLNQLTANLDAMLKNAEEKYAEEDRVAKDVWDTEKFC